MIVEVGPGLDPVGDGEAAPDAGGAIVAPGFIETHTHLDPALFWDPLCDPEWRASARDEWDTVFALDELHWDGEVMTDDLPGGASRLRRPEGGYGATVVAGVITQRDGKLTGARPGTVLGR